MEEQTNSVPAVEEKSAEVTEETKEDDTAQLFSAFREFRWDDIAALFDKVPNRLVTDALGQNLLHIVVGSAMRKHGEFSEIFDGLLKCIDKETLHVLSGKRAKVSFGGKTHMMSPLELICCYGNEQGIELFIDQLDASVIEEGTSIITSVATVLETTSDDNAKECCKRGLSALFGFHWIWTHLNAMLKDPRMIHVKDPDNKTLLHQVCSAGRSAPSVKLLIEHGADINDKNNDSEIPLTCVLRSSGPEKEDILRGLLQHGATFPNEKDDSSVYDKVVEAIKHNIHECELDVLIEMCAFFPAQIVAILEPLLVKLFEEKQSPQLECLLKISKEPILDLIRDINLDFANTDGNVLHFACNEEDHDLMLIALKCGLSPMSQNGNEETAFQMIQESKSIGFKDNALTLLQRYIKIDEITPSEMTLQGMRAFLEQQGDTVDINFQYLDRDNRTLLHSYCGEDMSLPIARLLLEHGANINITDVEQKTPLRHLVEHNGPVELLRLLLNFGAKPDVKDENGMDCVMYLIKEGDVHLLKEMYKIKQSHVIDALTEIFQDDRNSLITDLVRHDQVAKLKFIYKHLKPQTMEALTKISDDGNSLHIACSESSLEMIKLLLQYGIDPGVNNENEQSVIDMLNHNDKLSTAEKSEAKRLLSSKSQSSDSAGLKSIQNSINDVAGIVTETKGDIKDTLDTLQRELPKNLANEFKKVGDKIDKLADMASFITYASNASISIEYLFHEVFKMLALHISAVRVTMDRFIDELVKDFPKENKDDFKRKIDQASGSKQVYDALLIWKLCQGTKTAKEKFTVLKGKLRQSGLSQLLADVEVFEERSAQLLAHSTSAGSILEERNLLKLSQALGSEWKLFGIALELKNTTLEEIEDKTKSTTERAFQMLMKWSQQCPEQGIFKVAKLRNAMEEMNRWDMLALLQNLDPVSSRICQMI